MDGFGGYKSAATDQLPEATTVMDPFHVVALAGAKLDVCRQRIQQQTCGHRGRTGDPLYGVRRILRTRLPLLSARRKARLEAVFADEAHLAVELCWGFYQRMIAAYAHPDRRRGKAMMTAIITALRSGVPAVLEELAQLGRTLWRRRADVLAYFDYHASNGPTEAINGRLEALRRNALGFRNPTAVATDYRCGWHTVHDHVITVADAALEAEPAPVRVLGIDETRRGKAKWEHRPRHWDNGCGWTAGTPAWSTSPAIRACWPRSTDVTRRRSSTGSKSATPTGARRSPTWLSTCRWSTPAPCGWGCPRRS